MDILKNAREERGKVLEDMDKLLSKADSESRNFTAEEDAEFEKLEKRSEELKSEISKLEKREQIQKDIAVEREKAAAEKRSVEAHVTESPKIEVTNNHLKTKEARNAKTFSLIQGSIMGDADRVKEASKALRDGGHYDDLKEERAFQTLTDGKGGIFVPTTVSNDIFDIAQTYGVIPQYAKNLGNIIQNEVKVPQVLGRPTFTAVGQRAAISGSGFNFGGISLKALKWGTIIDWTNEVDESVGAKIMPVLFEKVAEAVAYLLDDTFFNGDGTSSYNNIKGIDALDGTVNHVRQTTAATGNVSFATLDAEDFNSAIYDVTPGARSGSIFVFHPNMLEHLHNLKDGQGAYIYGKPSEIMPVGSLYGYRIATSEAFPFTDGTSKTCAAFFNPNYVAYATGRALTATRLTEATVTDEDGNSLNLATMDAQAIRWTMLMDMAFSSVTRTTAGTAQGAFAVLRTAAS